MQKRIPPNKKLFLISVAFLFSQICTEARIWAVDEIAWQEMETKYAIIRYQSLDDLKTFYKKVDYLPPASGLNWLFSRPEGRDFEEKLKNKIDALYERVQEILDMRKKTLKVKVNIYKDKAQLKDAFFSIYKKEGRYRAWYIFEFNTIYINIADLHEGILAHEMAHAIIDHYLIVRPPSAFGITVGSPPSITAMHELVVPRSIPITFAIPDIPPVLLIATG